MSGTKNTCIPTLYLREYTGSDKTATGVIKTPLFSLQGASVSLPISMMGASMYLAKQPAPSPVTYDASNYTQVQLLTENIIHGPDYVSNSTLLYNSVSYKLQFVAIHASLWNKGSPQISMVFLSANNDIFHITIPIAFDTTFSSHTENQFLKWWLYPPTGEIRPSSFSVNDLLVFDGLNTSASFDFYQYCLNYNTSDQTTKNSYNFCNFTTPLYINNKKLPRWFANDTLLSNMNTDGFDTTSGLIYRLKSFNKIFSFIFKGSPIAPYSDPWLINNRNYFIVPGVSSGVKPSMYTLQVSTLAYKTPSGQSPERYLQNVKCYPIDLASQVDANGNIFIDESTNKPFDVSSLKQTPPDTNTQLQSQSNNMQNLIIYWVIFGLVIILSLAVIIALVVWMLPTQGSAIVPQAPPSVSPPAVQPLNSINAYNIAYPYPPASASSVGSAPTVPASTSSV